MVSEFPPRRGGVADYTAELAEAVGREGMDVSVLTFAEQGLRPVERLAAGPTVHRAIVPGLGSGLAALRTAKALRPDVVHIQLTTFLFNQSFYLFPVLYGGVPLVTTAHDVPTSYRTAHMLPFVRMALRKSRRVISLSDYVRNLLLSFHRVAPRRTALIPLAVNLTRFNPSLRSDEVRRRLGWEGRFVVLMAGFQNPAKGLQTLLRAVPLAGLRDLRVVIGGEFLRSGGPSLNRKAFDSHEALIRDEITKLGIRHQVEFRGYVPGGELPLLVANADVVALLHEYTFQSSSLHQAMASGCPIIASDIAGFQRFIADGKTGLMVPSNSPGALATALKRLHGDPEEARRLGLAARRFAEEKFDPANSARMHVQVYREALGMG